MGSILLSGALRGAGHGCVLVKFCSLADYGGRGHGCVLIKSCGLAHSHHAPTDWIKIAHFRNGQMGWMIRCIIKRRPEVKGFSFQGPLVRSRFRMD